MNISTLNFSFSEIDFASDHNVSMEKRNTSVRFRCIDQLISMPRNCPSLTIEDSQQVENICSFLPIWYLSLSMVYLVLGLPGGILTLVTVSSMSQKSTLVYIGLLAVADSSALLLNSALDVWWTMFHFEIYPVRNLFSSLRWLAEVCGTTSHWILMLICFERFVSIYFPFHKDKMFTIRKTWISSSIAHIVSWIPFASNWLVRTHKSEVQFDMEMMHSYLENSIYIFIPGIFIFVLTILVIVRLKQRSEISRRPSTSPLEAQLTRMMICTSVFFVVFVFPRAFILLYDDGSILRSRQDDTCPLSRARFIFVGYTLYSTCFMNHAVNFYIYITMGKGFRDSFLRVTGSRKSVPATRSTTKSTDVSH